MQRTIETLLGKPQKSGSSRDGTTHHHSPNEYGRPRFEIYHEDGAKCILRFMVQQRLPQLTGLLVQHLLHPNSSGCLGDLNESTSRLHRDGFVSRPNWDMLRPSVRLRPPPQIVEPIECGNTFVCVEHQFRDTVMLANRVLQTKPTCDHSPDHAPTKFCMGLPLRQGFA